MKTMISDKNDRKQKTTISAIQTAGDFSIQTAGSDSTQKAGTWAVQTARDWSTQTAGGFSEQTAGDWSTQTAFDMSLQTAGVNTVQIVYWSDDKNVLRVSTRIITEKEANKTYKFYNGDWHYCY